MCCEYFINRFNITHLSNTEMVDINLGKLNNLVILKFLLIKKYP